MHGGGEEGSYFSVEKVTEKVRGRLTQANSAGVTFPDISVLSKADGDCQLLVKS